MLNVQNLCCRRGGRIVFRNIGFTVEPGGLVLVTGANGTGKSSLLRLMAGLIAPLSGSIEWQGTAITVDVTAHRARLHYIGHLDALKTNLSVTEMLDYWRALRGGGRINLEAFALKGLTGRPVRSLSAGQKRRLSLTRLTIDHAPLWILDEPSTALDVQGQALLHTQIAEHRAKGGIVLIATHEAWQVPNAQRLEIAGAP